MYTCITLVTLYDYTTGDHNVVENRSYDLSHNDLIILWSMRERAKSALISEGSLVWVIVCK